MTDTTTYAAMDNNRIKKKVLEEIHSTGTRNRCRDPVMKPIRQFQVQKIEQKVMPGYFRSRIPEHDPAKGEAG